MFRLNGAKPANSEAVTNERDTMKTMESQSMKAGTMSVESFKEWATKNRPLALKVLAAMAFAQVERERVDGYIEPIFAKYGFRHDDDHGGRIKPSGKLLEHSRQLYLSKDDVRAKLFYEECRKANIEHGWKGDPELCPALTAESALTKAEQALLKAANGMMGINVEDLYGEKRKTLLDLLLGACVRAMKDKK